MAPDLARRVAITGIGIVGSFGIGTGALWGALGAGRNPGIRPAPAGTDAVVRI